METKIPSKAYDLEWEDIPVQLHTYLNEIVNYRYHWHESEYELNILLHGRAEFIRGNSYYTLEEGDAILIGPGVGHASYALEPSTIALVLRMSTSALQRFLPEGKAYCLDAVSLASAPSPDALLWRKIKSYASSLLLTMSIEKPTRLDTVNARAYFDLLCTSCAAFPSNQIISVPKDELYRKETISIIKHYIEEHFSDKITLDELAKLTKYNRTYISTLFKSTVGTRFYDYLTQVRLQHALFEFKNDSFSLTDIAINNGFPDLKNFNLKFKEVFHISPSQYRRLEMGRKGPYLKQSRNFYSPEDPLVKEALDKNLLY